MNVVSGPVTRFDGQVLSDRCLKSVSFDGDGLVTDRQQREAVVAGAIGRRGTLFVGSQIDESDASIRNDRA